MRDTMLEEQLAHLTVAFPSAQMALLPALQYAQQRGDITPPVITAIAQACQVSEDIVHSLLEAYSSLQNNPRKVAVCGGLSCWLKGAGRILAKPESFGLAGDEIERSFCLGHCFAAPVLRRTDGTFCHVELRREIFSTSGS